MNIEIPNSSIFAMIALKTFTDFEDNSAVCFSNGMQVLSSLPTRVDDYWTEFIGSFHSKEISDSNLILFTYTKENISEQMLERFLFNHFFGLLLQGVGYTNQGFNLSGVVYEGKFDLKSISTDFTYKYPPKVNFDSYTVQKEHLDKSILLSKQISKVFQNDRDIYNNQYLRLRKGFSAFIDGLQISSDSQLYKRLPLFVKAIEAIIKPEIGKTKKQFVERCGFFGGREECSKRIYEEIYNMRSSAEHLNPIDETLLEYNKYEILNIVCLRTYQIELLARHIYQTILLDDRLLETFKDDVTITAFWKKEESELKKILGIPFDFQSESKKWFINDLNYW